MKFWEDALLANTLLKDMVVSKSAIRDKETKVTDFWNPKWEQLHNVILEYLYNKLSMIEIKEDDQSQDMMKFTREKKFK